MSKLKCTCGNGMSNSNDPNEYIIKVYKKSDIENAIKENYNVRLIDFDTLDWDYEYWYCPKCDRIHKVENIPCGKVVKRFAKSSGSILTKECSSLLTAYYIFTDIEIYNAEEANMSLADFINELGNSHLYMISKDSEKIFKMNTIGEYQLFYQVEKTR